MDSSDDDADLRLALAQSRSYAQPSSSSRRTAPAASSSPSAATRRPAHSSTRSDAPIELGDSSDDDDDDIQVVDPPPPPPPPPPPRARARQPPSTSAAPSRRTASHASTSSSRPSAAPALAPPRQQQQQQQLIASGSSGLARVRAGLTEANAVRRRDVEQSSGGSRSGALNTGFDGLDELRRRAPSAAVGAAGGGRTLGRAPAQLPAAAYEPPARRLAGYVAPVPAQRENIEEGGMDAELMLVMHKSREDDERRRVLKEKQQALMAETDEEEALRLAIEASLNVPPPPPPPPAPAKSPDKRARSSSPSVTESEADDSDDDDGGAADPEQAFQKQMDAALLASKAERRKLVIPRTAGAAAGAGGGGGPLFGRPGLFDEGGRLSGSGASTPAGALGMADARPSVSTLAPVAPPLATRPTARLPSTSAQTPSTSTAAATPVSGVVPTPVVLPTGATRAQMEAERLQRIQARQAAAAPPAAAVAADGPSAPKKARLSSPPSAAAESSASAKGKGREPDPSSGRPSVPPAAASGSGPTFAQPTPTDRYWDGALGMTNNEYTRGLGMGAKDGAGRMFRLGDLISEPSDLALSIVSTFCIEPQFLARFLPHPLRTPCILVSHPANDGEAGTQDRHQRLPGVWDCFPFVQKYASAHMKFLLLWYRDGRMRVVISTANFMQHDWEAIENTVWVQDFRPRKASSRQRSDFGDQWVEILKALGVDRAYRRLRKSLEDEPRQLALLPFATVDELADKWDFSAVAVRLVASLQGKREGWKEIESSGVGRLGKVLREEGWVAPKGKRLNALEAQGSSLGDYSKPWINVFWRSVKGEEPRRFLRAALDSKEYPEGIKVVFPTLRTVDATHRGRPGGGTFFCNPPKFAKCPQYFHGAVSKRGGRTIMHLKILAGVFDPIPQTLGAAPRSSSSTAPGKALGAPAKQQQKLFDIDSETESETDDEDRVYVVKGKSKAPASPVLIDIDDDDEQPPSRAAAGGFMYVGSHNFSPSAWGTVTMAKAASKPTLNIRNYELGIVFPLRQNGADAHASSIAPYQRPVRPYGKDDVPWMQSEHMPPDV